MDALREDHRPQSKVAAPRVNEARRAEVARVEEEEPRDTHDGPATEASALALTRVINSVERRGNQGGNST